MLTVWGRKTSSNAQALMWCIGELGLACRRQDVGHRFGGTDSDAFRKLNPNQTIPVLQDGDNPPLWETGSILRYLAGQYSDETFWPAESVARANVDRWAEWAKINVALGFTAPVFWRVVRTPPAERDPVAIRTAPDALERTLRVAEDQIERHGFLAGPALTLADIQFGHILYRYFDIEIDRAHLPAVAAYYQRLAGRPAFREHVMTPYEELRA